jgi:hypothetical protein
VHRRNTDPTDFTPCICPRGAGGIDRRGRFDGTKDDPYSAYYAGLDAGTSLAEKFLRHVPFNNDAIRTIGRKRVANQRSSVVNTTTDLSLVSLLDAKALAAVAASEWLVHADGAEYSDTRRWARWIREQTPWAQGFIWPAKRLPGGKTIVLFGDRCADDTLSVHVTSRIDLDDEIGAVWINAVLAPYRARIMPPMRRRPTMH